MSDEEELSDVVESEEHLSENEEEYEDADAQKDLPEKKSRPKHSQKHAKRKRSNSEDEEEDYLGSFDPFDSSPNKGLPNVSDEEEESEHPRRKKLAVSDFFLDEVEVDSDEEEEALEEGMEDESAEAEEAAAMARMYERRRAREEIWKNMSEEQINQYFKDKYSRSTCYVEGEDEVYDDITQQGLLPTTKDPNLWTVKCRLGEEKLCLMQLMRKAIAYENHGEPLQITSAIVKEGLKGIIYIEAFKQSHVVQAIEGISALNSSKIQMVPISEMPDVLNVVKDLQALKPGVFVRLKRTMFRDDLAQVDWVDLAQKVVHLKLIPRIDYTRMRGSRRTADATANAPKRKRRPPAKLFDPDAVKAIGGEVSRDGDMYVFEGNRYSQRGFLYKGFPMNAIVSALCPLKALYPYLLADGIKPNLNELEKFQDDVEDLKNECTMRQREYVLLANTIVKDDGHHLMAGDNVEVIEGELSNLRGKVLSVDGNKIALLPYHPDLKRGWTLKEPLRFDADDLRKYFKPGDHVRITGGRYEGDTGLIVRVESNLVVLMSDLNMQEVSPTRRHLLPPFVVEYIFFILHVLPKDVQLCRDVATGVDSSGSCSYEDLVQLDQQMVGVIIQIEKDYLNVLNMHGKVVRVKQQSLYGKKDTKFAVALDSDGNNICAGDAVNVIDGPHAGMKGDIKHVYRSYIFVHSKTFPRNGGLFVCRSRHLLLAGAKPRDANDSRKNVIFTATGPVGLTTPAFGTNNRMKEKRDGIVGSMTPGQGEGRGGRSYVHRNKSLIGKSVKIIKGPMKGYHGIVKDASMQTARVELHTVCKHVNVDCSHLRVVEYVHSWKSHHCGAGDTFAVRPSFKTPRPVDGSRTPMGAEGGKTPMYGAQTPVYGAQTPMHDGSRTPYYGSQTPMHDGSRTPNMFSSAWDPSVANTPRPNLEDDFNYEESPSTMKYGGPVSVSPATPGGYSAETPLGSIYTPDDIYADSGQNPYASQASVSSPAFSIGSAGDYSLSCFKLAKRSIFSASATSSTMFGSAKVSGRRPLGASPFTIGSPMIGVDKDLISVGVEVIVRESVAEPQLIGNAGVVREVSLIGSIVAKDDKCVVYFAHSKTTSSMYVHQLELAKPQQSDRVKVMCGTDKNITGKLLSIDDTEGVVKTDLDDIRLYNMDHLCKISN
ncbi:Transcription elongation factor SPT5 [Trichuris trichiura]|uniref:Transcription elongation factor SPT5 n=1 Tax=Trichuris trichiura TaxID=36087 RepID=A0A077YWE2_TRITR|nr:Transcription elongation factor SPT5 [Trichuris trichiura]